MSTIERLPETTTQTEEYTDAVRVKSARQLAQLLVAEERREFEAETKSESILDNLGKFMLGDNDRFYVYLVNLDESQRDIDERIRSRLMSYGAYEGEASGAYTPSPELIFSDSDFDVQLYRWSNFVDYSDREPEAYDVFYEACRGGESPKIWEVSQRDQYPYINPFNQNR